MANGTRCTLHVVTSNGSSYDLSNFSAIKACLEQWVDHPPPEIETLLQEARNILHQQSVPLTANQRAECWYLIGNVSWKNEHFLEAYDAMLMSKKYRDAEDPILSNKITLALTVLAFHNNYFTQAKFLFLTEIADMLQTFVPGNRMPLAWQAQLPPLIDRIEYGAE